MKNKGGNCTSVGTLSLAQTEQEMRGLLSYAGIRTLNRPPRKMKNAKTHLASPNGEGQGWTNFRFCACVSINDRS